MYELATRYWPNGDRHSLTSCCFLTAHLHHALEWLRYGLTIRTVAAMVVFQFAYTSVFGAFAVFVHLRTGEPPGLYIAFNCDHISLSCCLVKIRIHDYDYDSIVMMSLLRGRQSPFLTRASRVADISPYIVQLHGCAGHWICCQSRDSLRFSHFSIV